jgi:hypothetical protein
MATLRPAPCCSRIGAAAASSNLVSVWENCMNGDLQRIEPRAVSAGVSIRQLPAAFAAAACESLVRRDDATLSVQSG